MKISRLLHSGNNVAGRSSGADPMTDETVICRQAREAIDAGRLPSRHPERAWGGPGTGVSCTLCGRPVRRDEIELELQFASGTDATGASNHHFHQRCFAVWDYERQNLPHSRTSAADTRAHSEGASASPLLASGNGGMITGGEPPVPHRREPT